MPIHKCRVVVCNIWAGAFECVVRCSIREHTAVLVRLWAHYKSLVYMNGGSVRKGKPHESSKAKLTWRNECISLCFGQNSTRVVHIIKIWIKFHSKKTNNFIIYQKCKRVHFIVFVFKLTSSSETHKRRTWEFISLPEDFPKNRTMISPREVRKNPTWEIICIKRVFYKNSHSYFTERDSQKTYMRIHKSPERLPRKSHCDFTERVSQKSPVRNHIHH